MFPFQGLQLAPGVYVGVGCQQGKEMLLFIFVMTLIGKHAQEVDEIGQDGGINLLAGIE